MNSVYDREWWYTRYWRATIAWMYIIICMFDFVIAPIAHDWFGWYANLMHTDHFIEGWKPLTLGAGGLFHISMGGILGVSSWSRGKEKIKEMETEVLTKIQE